MKLIKSLVLTFTLVSTASNAQDTISIMYYNVLNYPAINSARITYLETIAQHVLPDIFVVNELSSQAGADNILNMALNTNGITYYSAAAYVDGPDDENMLFYNSNKLGLVSQSEITTQLRNINEYILYYKNPGLTALSDTAYLYVYAAHLKAGSTQPDADDRASETATWRSYLNTRPYSENTICGGDFNIYYSTETAYFNMTASTQANLYDPVGPGSYHNNGAFTSHFTQSTRTEAFDGGATGGMDDRFDYILFSYDMLNGTNGAKFINGSYRSVGQDGLRWNSSLVSPVNNSEPAPVINALYYMSDHLPVYMEVEVGGELSVAENELDFKLYPNPADKELRLSSDQEIKDYRIVDLQGRAVLNGRVGSGHDTIDISTLEPGSYYITLGFEKGSFTKKLIVR